MATPDRESYTTFMQNKGLQPEIVSLPHGAEGYWLGNKDAKNVLIYYHGKMQSRVTIKARSKSRSIPGGGFVLPAIAAHFEFHTSLIQELNANGHEIAVFFLRYTLTPHGKYPTQLRQTVEALRYIVTETNRSPSNVVVGGDSAGGNLAMATLLHLSHPHPAIDPLQLSAPLAGVFGFAPWINFSADWPSMSTNAYKDLITPDSLVRWASAYLDGKKSDAWSEPDKAPAEWWKNPKTERILILVGGDEILLSPIEAFAQKIKVCSAHLIRRLVNDLLISLSSRIQRISLVMTSRMMHLSTLMLRPR